MTILLDYNSLLSSYSSSSSSLPKIERGIPSKDFLHAGFNFQPERRHYYCLRCRLHGSYIFHQDLGTKWVKGIMNTPLIRIKEWFTKSFNSHWRRRFIGVEGMKGMVDLGKMRTLGHKALVIIILYLIIYHSWENHQRKHILSHLLLGLSCIAFLCSSFFKELAWCANNIFGIVIVNYN